MEAAMSFLDKVKNMFSGGGNIDAIAAKKDFKGLVKALAKSRNDRDKLIAARVLGEMGDPRAFEPLVAALRDSDFYDCTYAAVALAKVGGMKAVPYLLAAMERHDSNSTVTKAGLNILGEKAFPALAAHYSRADVKFDMAALLMELDCAEAVPDIKKDFDRKEFSAYDTRYIERFLDRHQDLWPQGEKVGCIVCKKEAPVNEMKGSGDNWFCPGPCWDQRAKLLSKGIGKDCPLYNEGFCKAGDGQSFCSLVQGSYGSDCHVFAIQR
jgi:hypothetical protein